MPIYKSVNHNFFKKWSPTMAYVLGFFTADGNMLKNKRGAHFIEFTSIDKDILKKIKEVMGSEHKISKKIRKKESYHHAYRIQIGSKRIFEDLAKKGMTPNKSKTITLPKIPDKYFSHFVRGYFDGDGNVNFGYYKRTGRNKKSPILITRFSSGSKIILEKLKYVLSKNINTRGCLSSTNNNYVLIYSTNDSKKIFKFMYKNIKKTKNLIFLERKYRIFTNAGVA